MHFSLLIELNILVYLVMLYGEVISHLNGGVEW